MVEAFSQQAVFAAKLLAGEMPQDVEQAFEAAGVSLFPKKLNDLRTSCSCPDWSNPCKHVAAVYYLIGEEFDRDPFLIFKLRGLPRDELLRSLGGAAEAPAASPSKRRTKGTKEKQRAGQAATRPAEPAKPLPTDSQAFWEGGGLPADFSGPVRQSPVPAALPRRLGSFPFWRGTLPLHETLQSLYPQAAARGLSTFLHCMQDTQDER